MSGKAVAVIASVAIGVAAVPVAGQTRREGQDASRPAARRPNQARNQLEQLRYQIGTMERVLENAVEHGASVWRDRLQALAGPVQALLLDNARVRGYRLEGYGMFFDIDVPSLETTLFSAFRTLDQNGLNLQNALSQLKAYIPASDTNLQQALKRIELQVVPAVTAPVPTTAAVTTADAAGRQTVAVTPDVRVEVAVNDPILVNPEEVYRAEVMQAVVDALLDYSASLGLGPDEWLAVGVRRNEVRPRIGLDNNAQTVVARVRGGDLSAFRSGQLTREDAIKRVEVRVF